MDEPISVIRFPVPIHRAKFHLRFGAVLTDVGIACLDLKYAVSSGRAKMLTLVPGVDTSAVIALNQAMMAVGGRGGIGMIDIASNASSFDLRVQPAVPRSRNVTCIDWSNDPNILASGSAAGTVQLWDIRASVSPVSHAASGINYDINLLKFNRYSSEYVVGISQGDVVTTWDYRSTKYPVKQTVLSGKSNVISFDFVSSSNDVVAVLDSGDLVRCGSTFDRIFSDCHNVASLPAAMGGSLLALACDGLVNLVDSVSYEVLENLKTGTRVESIGYLDEVSVICLQTGDALILYGIEEFASKWSCDTSQLMASESSPRIAPVPSLLSNTGFSDQSSTEEMKAARLALTRIARRLRRMYLEAEVEEAMLEVAIPLEPSSIVQQGDGDEIADAKLKLKVALRIEFGDSFFLNEETADLNQPRAPTICWELWWAQQSPFLSEGVASLPDPNLIQQEYLSHLALSDILGGQPGRVALAFKKLKSYLASLEDEVMASSSRAANSETISTPTASSINTSAASSLIVEEDQQVPFPPTCGVCWSPRGDLFRFHSLKGMSPWPSHREKLTMASFSRLKEENDRLNLEELNSAATGKRNLLSDSGALASIKLNVFTAFVEPLNEDADDDFLDSEFHRHVTTDQCVQFLPATVFEESVEDHWFASLAPVIRMSGKRSDIAADLFQHLHAHHLALPGDAHQHHAAEMVSEVWQVLIELFKAEEADPESFKSSALKLVVEDILQTKLRLLYQQEQTQTIAVIGGLLLGVGPAKSAIRITDESLLQSVYLLVHDHAVLFQRLGCFHPSRVLEKVQQRTRQQLPLLLDSDAALVHTSAARQKFKPPCAVCSFTVHGIGQYCSSCGHGGHLKHMSEFFNKGKTQCPVSSCVCCCPELVALRQPQLASVVSPVASTFISS